MLQRQPFELGDRQGQQQLDPPFQGHGRIHVGLGLALGIAVDRGNGQRGLVTSGTQSDERRSVEQAANLLQGVDVGAKAEVYRLVRELATNGMAVLMITHDPNLVRRFADRVTVMRGGRTIATVPAAERSPQDLTVLIVGEQLQEKQQPSTSVGAPVLSLSSVVAARPDGHRAVKDVSLNVCAGEIYGIAGVGGNGQTELAEVLMGVNKVLEGRPHIVDMMKDGKVQLVFNTVDGASALTDSFTLRRTALMHKIAYYTTVAGAKASVEGIAAVSEGALDVAPLQSYFKGAF